MYSNDYDGWVQMNWAYGTQNNPGAWEMTNMYGSRAVAGHMSYESGCHDGLNDNIGWDWTSAQVDKCSAEIGISLELWKVKPSGVGDFEIEVREVARREGIDDSQAGLDSFE